MKELAQKLLEAKRQKAAEMVGKKIEVQISHKAISIDEEAHTATFVMSTANIDRHGDIIDQESWNLKYFEQSPMFFLQHRSDEFPLGKWLKIWFETDPENAEGKQRMVGTAEFAVDLGEDIERAWKHVVRGDMNAVSVGFIPHRVEYDEHKDAFILYDCELLECSLVGIGSNRQALVKDNPRDTMIEARKQLDEVIHSSEDNKVISELKARDMLNKAIRRMRTPQEA